MPTTRWIRGTIAAAIAAGSLWFPGPERGIAVVGGTPEQRAMTAWAVQRFEEVGLTLPALEVRFNEGRDACRGHLGYYLDGVVEVCREHTNLWASRELLHEMAHGWLEANLSPEDRARFLKLRQIRTWNDQAVIWDERGFEHGAEIMAWAIGDQADGIYTPSIPDNDPLQLAAAYRMLTGYPLPELTPSVLWARPLI
jgi:hypothetical protein